MPQDHNRELLDLLYNVSREVATALDLRTVLQRVLYAAVQYVGGERGTIVVVDDNGKAVDATIIYGTQFHDHTTLQLRETLERGLAGWVVRNREAVLLPDTSRDPRWLRRPDDSDDQTGAKSAISVPLLSRERLVGVLTLVHPIPNTFGLEHLELMQAIADQAGIAVSNARLYAESQRQARVMTALAEGAVAINASLRLVEVLQSILDQTSQALQVETAALALIDPSSGDLVFHAATGEYADSILRRRISVQHGVAGWVVREKRGVVVPVVGQDGRVATEEVFTNVNLRALACAPIQAQGQVIGVLEAINPISGTFDPDALLVMTGIGSLAGTTIQNAQLYSRLEAAHRRYRELFEDSIDPIILSDSEGHILEANRQAVELSGYPGEALRKMALDQLHEVKWDRTGLEYEKLKDGQTLCYESVLQCQDERQVPVEVYVRTVEFEESECLQWILRDVTERRNMDALREDLSAMIYHDLRSPLSNVISSLSVMAGMVDPVQSDEAHSLISIASNSTNRIQRMLSSLLDINRLESGQKIVTQQAVDPAVLVGDAVNEVHSAAESRKQTIDVHAPVGRLRQVWVDADMVRRVLINLLENAIKFTPVEGKIDVGAEPDGEWVRLWVQDTGPGVPEADKERIFDKFSRLRHKDAPSGLGVGLAFCRLAVQGHGGRIWEAGGAGKGARFVFTLPVTMREFQEKTK
jgi:PAS domain S-box-containing protein